MYTNASQMNLLVFVLAAMAIMGTGLMAIVSVYRRHRSSDVDEEAAEYARFYRSLKRAGTQSLPSFGEWLEARQMHKEMRR